MSRSKQSSSSGSNASRKYYTTRPVIQGRTLYKKLYSPSSSSSRYYKKSADFVICKLPFSRLVKQIAQALKEDVRFKPTAVKTLREYSEAYIISLFEESHSYASRAKRVTIMPEDLRVAVQMRRERK